jgi:hypothetical protein
MPRSPARGGRVPRAVGEERCPLADRWFAKRYGDLGAWRRDELAAAAGVRRETVASWKRTSIPDPIPPVVVGAPRLGCVAQRSRSAREAAGRPPRPTAPSAAQLQDARQRLAQARRRAPSGTTWARRLLGMK